MMIYCVTSTIPANRIGGSPDESLDLRINVHLAPDNPLVDDFLTAWQNRAFSISVVEIAQQTLVVNDSM